MMEYKLSLIGFGNVGQAFARLLLQKQAELKHDYGITFAVTGIYTGRHGAALDAGGLDLRTALGLVTSGDNLNALSAHPDPADGLAFITASGAHVLFETIPGNYQNGQPALDYLRTALELGMHVITANKGPVVHGYQELTQLAERKGRKFYFESAVMDGAPIFSLFRSALPAARLLSLRGILNSTTNLILGRMEGGESFEQAVGYAQSIGIAETDPAGDIDGWDAAVKVAALVTVLMGIPLKPIQVQREGIRGISADMIQQALSQGKRWKLVCMAKRKEGGIQTRVAPELVGMESPLYNVEGTSSIVEFETDVLGQFSIVESNPGPQTTAYGMLADFINAVR